MVAINRLTAMHVKKSGPGKYADGAGLWLHRRADGGAQWFLRYVIYGKRREMGLGSLDNVSLKEARKLAEEWRSVVREGNDPIKVRDKRQREEAKDENTLEDIAKEAFESRKAELKGDGTAGRWFSPLELHILPKLGKFPVEEIDQKDIKNALQPIWHSKGETARKAINRLGIVLKYAAALELDVDIQAVDKAKILLGKSRQQSKKIPALDWKEVPAFYQNLGNSNISELALRLLILTGVRSGPLRFARWEQIDGDVWTIPAENMKGRVGEVEDFEVPLSKESLLVLERVRPFERDGFIFPGQRKGVMSDMAMTKFLKDSGHTFRPHGFRSSLRTWCADKANVPREIAEALLSHSIGSKLELTYMRSTLLEHRKEVLDMWADYLLGRLPEKQN